MSSNHARPVVVAVADEHDAALRVAAADAVRERRPLRVVHVVHPPPHGLAGPESVLLTFAAVEVVAEQLVRAQYERALELVDGRVAVEKVLRGGPVIETLLELSQDADHIVVQRREQRRIRRLVTGSTTAGLAARAPVPVVSVPEAWAGPRATPLVVVGLGDHLESAGNCHLLDRAFDEALARNAALTVVHAWYLAEEYRDFELLDPTLEDFHRLALTQLEHHLRPHRRSYPTVDLRIEVPHLRPIEALVRASRHSDLVLVGRSRSHGVNHLGSVVRTLVHESLSPVVVVAQPDPSPISPLESHAQTTRRS